MVGQSKVRWVITCNLYRCQFHQHSKSSFCASGAQKRKKTIKSSVFLHFWDLRVQKFHVNMLVKLTPGKFSIERIEMLYIEPHHILNILILSFNKTGFRLSHKSLSYPKSCQKMLSFWRAFVIFKPVFCLLQRFC